MRPAAAILPDGRLHLQHGPIDLIIGVEPKTARNAAYRAAHARFETVLSELVAELPLLRSPMAPGMAKPTGKIANRMDAATRPFSQHFVTRMAAVAGSVADEVLEATRRAAPLTRAYVNNGGDISVFLTKKQTYKTAIRGHNGRDLGRISIKRDQGIGGIATSGRHGRSFSLGIADSVTVLARSAAMADVAATLIANAVDLPGHPRITRVPACTLDPDSDLGEMPVVTACSPLSTQETARALVAGLNRARDFRDSGLIIAAALFLQDDVQLLGDAFTTKHLA